jgi:hypothetical protein
LELLIQAKPTVQEVLIGGNMAPKKVKATSTTRGTEVKTRTSLKQKFADYYRGVFAEYYRGVVTSYIYRLQNPYTTPSFSVKAYETTPTGKKPNAINAPELLALVGTAKKLGKTIRLDISGVGDTAQLDVVLVDGVAALPDALRWY